ncbi:MAG: hypothetical protein H6667_05000 [Ardenticatenaceae bacterium]|nr:hypothetical protein [Ardenticatenaceae bacterium]
MRSGTNKRWMAAGLVAIILLLIVDFLFQCRRWKTLYRHQLRCDSQFVDVNGLDIHLKWADRPAGLLLHSCGDVVFVARGQCRSWQRYGRDCF